MPLPLPSLPETMVMIAGRPDQVVAITPSHN